MRSMVDQVVNVLDEGSVFMNPSRILKSRIPKKVRPRTPIRSRPPVVSSPDKQKERIRKIVTKQHPDTSMQWTGQKWKVREQEKQKIMEMLLPLEEIPLRTGAIAVYLAKVKQYANAVDRGVNKLKSLSSKLQNASDEKERTRTQGEIVRVDADVLSSLRKMQMYGSLVSASGGLGADRSYKILKKMEKQKHR